MKRPAMLASMIIWFLSAATAQAGNVSWARSWAASPQAPLAAMGPIPGSPTFRDQTIRQFVRLSGGGKLVRIRFTNEFGNKPLKIGSARMAIAASGGTGAIVPGSDHILTFNGSPTAIIPLGAPLLSDPVAMDAPALSKLAVSLYLPGDAEACTCHLTGQEIAFAVPGDMTGAVSLPDNAQKLSARAFLSAVDIDAQGAARTIVAFGDSITDGIGATVNSDRRWPDRLAERLLESKRGAIFVANQGISGNRVLNEGLGASALSRFDRDVLSTPGLSHVILLEGINDIGISYMPQSDDPFVAFMRTFAGAGAPVTAQDIIAGYKQLIDRAHQHGVKIYGATITPYEGVATYSAQGEAVRQAVNSWIRDGGSFDGVLDFDAVLRDPAHPTRIRDGFHMGDFLHGSDAGYKTMAEAIDLSMFK